MGDGMKLLMFLALAVSFFMLIMPAVEALQRLHFETQACITFVGYLLLYGVIGLLVLEQETGTEPKDETDRMIKKGYVLNVETGKWEKPR